MVKISFERCSYDNCVYMKREGSEIKAYLLLYVDDMLIASADKSEIDSIKQLLDSVFDMKYLGEAKKILGMEIKGDRKSNKLFTAN